MARETGGRSYRGIDDLDANLAAAAEAFFGIYRIGFYRDDDREERGKIKVTIDRPGAVVNASRAH